MTRGADQLFAQGNEVLPHRAEQRRLPDHGRHRPREGRVEVLAHAPGYCRQRRRRDTEHLADVAYRPAQMVGLDRICYL
jgi:hypothetical protein